ncbi:MAG: hypothetical protein AVDCRST_MAG22-1122, partial [uncultured Rubrobacteraceae bacterium]
ERLLRRPQEEDPPSPRSGSDQERGRSFFRGESLLGQALRQAGRRGSPAGPKEGPRSQTEDGRGRKEAIGARPPRTSRGHALRAARVPGPGGRGAGERIHREQGARAPGMEPKKRSLAAGERDEFL